MCVCVCVCVNVYNKVLVGEILDIPINDDDDDDDLNQQFSFLHSFSFNNEIMIVPLNC